MFRLSIAGGGRSRAGSRAGTQRTASRAPGFAARTARLKGTGQLGGLKGQRRRPATRAERHLFADDRVSQSQRLRDPLAVLTAGVVETVAHPVHDADLHRGVRIDRPDRLGRSLQAIDCGDQDVLAAACLQTVE